ncbi:acetyl-CoA carboxylase biotin carboxylase subunit family protein [Streptomyces sp. NPDC059175]|uniref:ATP-grasp domain-containing protein n=1 Tax=unclassified Streptomyces TaxID=2593676 RepID=UPI0036B71050
MQLYLLALNPTDSVTEGFLPAARRLGLHVTMLTDQPSAHRAVYPDVEILECDVRDVHAVISRVSAHRAPDAVFSNSDHVQTQTALAADYFGLPAKNWRSALRAKDKAQMRRHLRAAAAAGGGCAPGTGEDLLAGGTVRSVELAPGQDPTTARGVADLPYPCVVKPREGVASEDVFLVEDLRELGQRCKEIRARRPGAALVVEEYLPGDLYTLETLGDGRVLHTLGGFRTELSPPPHFIEERLSYVPAHSSPVAEQVLAQLDALGVGFGACHTEFVVHDGRARIIEVNYRAVGDQCDLLLAELLDVPYFEHVLRTHLGEPLPVDLGLRTGVAARLHYPCADRAGTLASAPAAVELEDDGVKLTYRPLRAVGERHELYRTNRDFLGVVRATGVDQGRVDRAVRAFLEGQHWEIAP